MVENTIGKLASRNTPPGAPDASCASARMRPSAASMTRASCATRKPSAVGTLWRRSRVNSGAPRCSSNWAMAWLAPDCVMPTCFAACVMLPASTTASSSRQCIRFIMASVQLISCL